MDFCTRSARKNSVRNSMSIITGNFCRSRFPQAPTGGDRHITYTRMAAGSPLSGRRRPLLVRCCSVLVPDHRGNIVEVVTLHASTVFLQKISPRQPRHADVAHVWILAFCFGRCCAHIEAQSPSMTAPDKIDRDVDKGCWEIGVATDWVPVNPMP